MDMQQLLTMAAGTFMNNAGSSAQGLDVSTVVSALSGLLGGQNGQVDLGGLLGSMNSSGLMTMAASWLGDGGNEAISAQSIMDLFGQSKVDGFAQTLGLSQPDAVSGLQAALPQLMDQASQGGELMANAGNLGSALKGLFS